MDAFDETRRTTARQAGEEAGRYQLTCLTRIMVSSRIVLNYSPVCGSVC